MYLKQLLMALSLIFTFSALAQIKNEKIWSSKEKLEIARTLSWVMRHQSTGEVKEGALVEGRTNMELVALLAAGYKATEVYTRRDIMGAGCVLMFKFDNDSTLLKAYTVTDLNSDVWRNVCN